MSIQRTPSFVQDQKHTTKSERFQPVCAESIAKILAPLEFEIVALKSGQAIKQENAAHQTTLARYRNASNALKINGLAVDIVAKVPHLYGAIELFLGTHRQICLNGLVVGTKFDVVRIKHLGNPITEIQRELPRLVAQYDQMRQTVEHMQRVQLSTQDRIAFAREVASIRLRNVDNVVRSESSALLIPHRVEDQATDLFTVFNVIQENIVRVGLKYQFETKDVQTGETKLRNGTARRVRENTIGNMVINRQMWDVAESFLQAA